MLAYQFSAIIRVKFLLIRGSLERISPLGKVLLLLLFLGCGLLSIALSAALFYAARRISADTGTGALLFLLDGTASLFLFFFLWSVLIELQRNDGIAMDKFLALPIRPVWIFLFNFLMFICTPLFFFSLPPLVALAAGLIPRCGIFSLFPIVLFALLFITALNAWAYWLCSVLALWMINKRRRRLVFVIVPVVFVILAQLPTLLLRFFLTHGQQSFDVTAMESYMPGLLGIHQVIPFLLPIYGLWNQLIHTNPAAVALSFLASLLFIAAGLYLGYATTMRYYRSGHSESPADNGNGRKKKKDRELSRKNHAFFPAFTASDIGYLTFTFFRSYVRHPHMRMLFLMPASMGLFMIFLFKGGGLSGTGSGMRWVPHFWLFLPFLNFSFFLMNIFGAEGRAFQTLMLLPVPRYRYLIAKNLAMAPFLFGLSFFLFAATLFFYPMTIAEIAVVLALVFHLFLVFSATGNLYSLYFPQPVQRDAMRAPVSRVRLLGHMIVLTFATAVMVLPASLCFAFRHSEILTWSVGNISIMPGLSGSLILFILSCIYYRAVLYRAGDLLQEREQLIFTILSQENE